ncbi:MAG: hypothetical protein DRN27_10005 [Thermoplasmata archaeon]|nr:MAG: hypothetical protein DRN27_10005 [Thermoplasmata archaeon]
MEYEKFESWENTYMSRHVISSDVIMTEKETGRVVAVFYNDYDLDDVLEQLKKVKENGTL